MTSNHLNATHAASARSAAWEGIKASFLASVGDILATLRKHPGAMLKFQVVRELHVGGATSENPYTHAAWMFVSDLYAAFTPVVPFALLAIGQARIISLMVTAILLILVGIGRGLISHRNIALTAIETLAIAAAAAVAGVVIGKLISGGI